MSICNQLDFSQKPHSELLQETEDKSNKKQVLLLGLEFSLVVLIKIHPWAQCPKGTRV